MSNNSLKNNWLILGGGAVVTEYHLPALEYLGLLANVTIVDPSVQQSKLIKSMYDCRVVNSTYQEFLSSVNHNEFQRCIVALPNKFHLDAITSLLKLNIDILCEKPLVRNIAEYEKLFLAASNSTARLSVAMVRRLSPAYLAAKRILESKGLENLKEVRIEDGNPFAWVADSYAFFDPENGGVLADMGVHYLDMLAQIFTTIDLIDYSDDVVSGVEANAELHLKLNQKIKCSCKFSRTYTLQNVVEFDFGTENVIIKKDDYEYCYIKQGDLLQQVSIEDAFQDRQLKYDYVSCFVEQIQRFDQQRLFQHHYHPIESVRNTIQLIEQCYSLQKRVSHTGNGDKIFITGATGFIGSAIINQLAITTEITASIRSYKNCADIGRFKLKYDRSQLTDAVALRKAMHGQQYVIHLAYASEDHLAYEMNVNATKNVIEAAIANKVESVVILSTMYVYGQDVDPISINEQSPIKPYGGKYAESKAQMQAWILERAKSSPHTRLVVLNPSCVFGPRGKTYTTLPSALEKSNRFAWINGGSGIANYVYIDNLIEAILLALHNTQAHGKNYIINDGSCTWKEFLSPMLEKPGQLPDFSEVNDLSRTESTSTKQIFRFLFGNYELMELVNKHAMLGPTKRFVFRFIPGFKNKLNSLRADEMKKGVSLKRPDKIQAPPWLQQLYGMNASIFQSSRAKAELGWESKVTLSDGLQRTRTWLVDHNFLR